MNKYSETVTLDQVAKAIETNRLVSGKFTFEVNEILNVQKLPEWHGDNAYQIEFTGSIFN